MYGSRIVPVVDPTVSLDLYSGVLVCVTEASKEAVALSIAACEGDVLSLITFVSAIALTYRGNLVGPLTFTRVGLRREDSASLTCFTTSGTILEILWAKIPSRSALSWCQS